MYEAAVVSAPTLEVRPGRPRDVHSGWCWVDHPDGTVSYVIHRRAESGAPSGVTLAFHGETEAEAYGAYEDWGMTQYDRVRRGAERRAKWGPLGTGKMA